MKAQVLKLLYHGTYTVIWDCTRRTNQYIIYHAYNECFQDAPAKKHKKKIAEYADLASCLYYLADIVTNGR